MKKDADVTMISGGRGSGKTTCQIELMQQESRVLTLDPVGTWNARGFKVVNSLAAAYQEIKAGWNSGFKIVLRTPRNEVQCVKLMRQLSLDLQVIQGPYYAGKDTKTMTLCIDEAHKFFPNRKMTPEEQEPLEDIITVGRHYGINMIAATQRLSQMWTCYRGNSGKSYFFRQGDHTDYSAVLSVIGTEWREELRGLLTHEYLYKGEGMEITKGRNRANFK